MHGVLGSEGGAIGVRWIGEGVPSLGSDPRRCPALIPTLESGRQGGIWHMGRYCIEEMDAVL